MNIRKAIADGLEVFNEIQNASRRTALTGQEIGIAAQAIYHQVTVPIHEIRELISTAQTQREIDLQAELDRAIEVIIHLMVRGDALEITTDHESILKDTATRELVIEDDEGHLTLRVIKP